jgi:hypothetical protein
MPLIRGKSRKAVGQNIKSEMDAGKPQKQSIAIALDMARRAGAKMPMKKAMGGELSAKDEMRANADNAKSDRDESMLDGHPTMDGPEIDFSSERRASADNSLDAREMAMRKRMMAIGGEINFHDESEANADNARDMREMAMLDSKPLRHADELSANDEGHVGADSRDDMEMSMMRDQLPSDSYSKRGIVNFADGGELDDSPASLAQRIRSKRSMMTVKDDSPEDALQEMNGNENLNQEDDMSFNAARKKTYFDDSQLSKQPMDSNLHGDNLSDEDSYDMVDSIRRKMKSKR